MSKKPKGLQHTIQVRLYPTPEQSHLLMAHCQAYISTVNVLVAALDADLIPNDSFSTKDFLAALPSAVKNQVLRDARSVFKRSLDLGVIPVLKKPICQWNCQNWQMEQGILSLPVHMDGKTQQVHLRCAQVNLEGLPGILRIKKRRGKWIADITMTIAKPAPLSQEGIMGIDLGIKVPAVAYTPGYGTRFFGNGRYQRMMRRRFHAHRKQLQKAGKQRALNKRARKEARWMKDINHKVSRQIVNHAVACGVGTIRLEALAGIRQRTTRQSRGATTKKARTNARKHNRMMATWTFSQLTLFIRYKAERVGIKVEMVDPAYTSQLCPACAARNKADDRTYVCADCGWHGHRDGVGAINISRRTGPAGRRQDATSAMCTARGRVA